MSFIAGPIGGSGSSSVTIQTDTGTSPVGSTIDITSPVLDVNGNSSTDVVTLQYKAEISHGDMGATETFDFSAGPAHYGNVSADCTVTLSNPADGGSYVILIEANGTNEVIWPTITWLTAGGVAPDISALSDGEFCIVNLYRSGTKSAYIGTYAVPTS